MKISLNYLALAAVSILWGAASADYSPGYYDSMEGLKRDALKAAAKECVKDHWMLVYYDLPTYWQYSDVYPELVDGCRRWWEMYSDEVYLIRPGQTAKSSFSACRMQREHSVPKSWWKSGNSVDYTPCYSDMWNLYPSDAAANQAKSNYPLGETDTKLRFDNGVTRVGEPAPGFGGGCAFVFEPDDEYKGDFARSFFYVATVYDDLPWSTRYGYMFASNPWPTLKSWAYTMLLRWAAEDPVSQKEILRNDAVEKSQGNRNPFVDFPELAEYIWGARTQEAFYIADQGGTPMPPITGDPELTAPINGEALDFGQVAVGGVGTSWLVIKGKNLTAPLSFRTGGADKDDFILSTRTISAAQINKTGEYMLTIQFKPTTLGTRTATLSIYDGGLPGSIRVDLKGEGCEVPTLSRLTALPASDITDTSYVANWMAAPQTVDYYVVKRTRFTPEDSETDELEAATNSLQITGREPEVMETYSVCSSRLGYLSEASNTITVEASAVGGLSEDYDYAVVAPEVGGFRLLTRSAVTDLQIFDTTGRLVAAYPSLSHGDFVELPQGAFIIVSAKLLRPVKIIN